MGILQLTTTEIIIVSILAIWVAVNAKFLNNVLSLRRVKFAMMFSGAQLRLAYTVFIIRFIISFLLLAKSEYFEKRYITLFGYGFEVNIAYILVALLWIPEIIALLQWALFFSVFGLAGLGAAIYLDLILFNVFGVELRIFGRFGPISGIMLVLIIASFRYFSNYSIGEIMRIAERAKFQRIIVLLSGVSYMLIGGGFIWRVVIESNIYQRKISPILDKIETFTAATSVLVIIVTLPMQMLNAPVWICILVLINAPVAFSAVAILLLKHGFRAWKHVFEIYTEEFAAQSLTLMEALGRSKWRSLLKIALIGNWAAVPVALYDIGVVIWWLLHDVLLVCGGLMILGIKYVSSMVTATKKIIRGEH